MLEGPISNSGWTKVALGEVAINSTVATLQPEEDGFVRYIIGKHIPGDGNKITTWNEVGDGEFGSRIRTIIKKGDIVCTTRGPKLRVAVATFDCLSAHTNFVLRTKDSSALLQEFLQAIACSEAFQDHLRGNFRGSTNLFVNWSDAAAFEFLLPPIQEQARLVEALIAAQDSSEYMLGLIEATRIAQIAAFEELLRRADAKPVTLGSIMTTSPRNGYSPVAASRETGHWVLALSAISKWGYRHDQLKPVEVGPETLGSRISKGDLVISRSNTRDLVGLPMVFPEDRSDVSYPDTMMRISVDPTTIGTDYLEMCLRSPKCRRQVQSFAAGTSSSMLKINGANLRKVSVPLVPVKRQAEILEGIAQFTAALAFAERRFEETRQLQIRIANDALSGIVTA